MKRELLIYQAIYELWVVTERMRSRIQAARISFLRREAELSLCDGVKSSDIQKQLEVEPPLLCVERGDSGI